MQTNTSNKTKILVEGALMIAMATVLSYLKLFELPQGGSITLEMIPLILMGLRNGTKYGFATGLVHGVLQMILGFSNVMYCSTLIAQLGCILLDYVVAFAVLGLADLFAKPAGRKKLSGLMLGTTVVCLLRFLCSFLSGWLLWGSYAPEGTSAVWYSLIYNGTYMLPDTIIAVVVIAALYKTVPKMFVNCN